MSLLSDYKSNVKEFRLEEPLDFLLYRPLAYIIVKLTLFLPLTPNHFTLIAIVCAAIAGYQLSLGNPSAMMMGGVFIYLFNLFDCCDGMVARLKKNSSKYGDIIDMFADTISNLFFFGGLFIGLKKMMPDSLMPYLIIASIIILSIHVSLYNFYKKQYYFYLDNNPAGRKREIEQYRRDYDELKRNSVWNFNRLLLGFFLTFSKTQDGREKDLRFDSARYIDCNRSILPLWAVIAGSTHLTVLAGSLVIGSVSVFFFFSLILSNLWMILVMIIQSGVNSNLKVD